MEGVQARPVMAYAVLAVLATLLLMHGMQRPPERVVVAAPLPASFTAPVVTHVEVGKVLVPRPAPARAAVPEGTPTLQVPAVVQPAIGPGPSPAQPPQPQPQPPQPPVTVTQPTEQPPTVVQPPKPDPVVKPPKPKKPKADSPKPKHGGPGKNPGKGWR